MSIVPWRVFLPSVINYYVVEKIHRPAEKTECWNIWKQLEKKYNHVKPIIQFKKKKVYFSNGKHQVRELKSPWHFNSGEVNLSSHFILLKTEILAFLAESHILGVIKLT